MESSATTSATNDGLYEVKIALLYVEKAPK